MISMCKIHFTLILKVSDEFVEKCRRSRLTLGRRGFEIWPLWWVFGVFLGIEWPIWVWLTPNLVCISGAKQILKNCGQNGENRPAPLCSHGQNLAFFIKFWQTSTLKWLARWDESNGIKFYALSPCFIYWFFGPIFEHGQCCTYGLKTTLKLLVHVLAIMASSYLKIVF